jgi:hypothetical protein
VTTEAEESMDTRAVEVERRRDEQRRHRRERSGKIFSPWELVIIYFSVDQALMASYRYNNSGAQGYALLVRPLVKVSRKYRVDLVGSEYRHNRGRKASRIYAQ